MTLVGGQQALQLEIGGHAQSRFAKVKDAFADNFSTAHPCHEVGATFSAYRGDECLVHLWGGHADAAKTRPWTEHTVVNMFSSTKGVAAACGAVLNSRGLLDYDAPVVRYWPEFGQNGKERITVSEALSHRGGLSGLREPTTIGDVCDWPTMIAKIERAAPLWQPGSTAGYHAITWGFLAGELVRRTAGKPIGQFLAEEIADPLHADLSIGSNRPRSVAVAEMIKASGPQTQTLAEMSDILKLTLGNPVIEAEVANQANWQAAEIPAANGLGNGEGLARLYAALANGGRFNGTELLSSEAVQAATREVFRGNDMNLGKVIGWSAGGFFLNNEWRWYGPNDAAFGHSGWGGSYGFADPVEHLGVGYVPNQMDTNLQGDPRAMRLISALYDCL